MSGDNEAKYWCEICGMLGEMCYHLMAPGNMNGAIYPILGIQHPEFSKPLQPSTGFPDIWVKKERKYLPTLAELCDRLCITQQKEIYIPEHREEYSKEIEDILHDIDLLLSENKIELTANLVRNIIILTQMNTWIWNNESNFRKGIKEGNNLELTHGLNGIRNTAKNKIQETAGGRKDYKIDNVEAFKQWIPSGYEK